MGNDLCDEIVYGLSGLDQHHDAAGALELGNHFGDGMGAENPGALGLVVEEGVDLGDGAVVGDDGEAVVVHVQDKILTHDGQTDKGDVSLRFHDDKRLGL